MTSALGLSAVGIAPVWSYSKTVSAPRAFEGEARGQTGSAGDRPRELIAALQRSGRPGLRKCLERVTRHTATEMFWHLLVAAVFKWIVR